jgi:hypothetical protein
MPYGVLQEMPAVSEHEYKLVEKNLGPDRPAGLIAHVSGSNGNGGWRVVNIWTDEGAFRRFQSERLMRAAGLAAREAGFDAAKAAGFWSMVVDGDEMPF